MTSRPAAPTARPRRASVASVRTEPGGPAAVWRRMRFTAPAAVRRAMILHARREQPNECCGFLLGRGSRIQYALPMQNVSASATRYRIDDAAHIVLRRWLRGMSPPLSIVGVYHSHPAGDAEPSDTDVREAMYPEWVYVIVGLRGDRPAVRAFGLTWRQRRA